MYLNLYMGISHLGDGRSGARIDHQKAQVGMCASHLRVMWLCHVVLVLLIWIFNFLSPRLKFKSNLQHSESLLLFSLWLRLVQIPAFVQFEHKKLTSDSSCSVDTLAKQLSCALDLPGRVLLLTQIFYIQLDVVRSAMMGDVSPKSRGRDLAEQISRQTSELVQSSKHRDLLDIVDSLRSNGVSH